MLSVVIVSHNSIKYMIMCLESLFRQSYGDFETIVIDNGSSDNTANFIKSNYPNVKLIENQQNLGACKARNQGIENSSFDWILTLDCDVVLENDFIGKLMEESSVIDKEIGSIQPKVLDFDKKTIYSCGIYLSKLRRYYDIGRGKPNGAKYNYKKNIFGCCAAAALYRKEMLIDIKDDAGYFDEKFFFLVEDVDLSWRAQNKGWKAVFSPEPVCYHKGDSSNCSKEIRQILSFRNRYRMINKNETLFGKLKIITLGFFYESMRAVFMALTNKYFWKYLRGSRLE